MEQSSSPYRRSIWKRPTEYDVNLSTLTEAELATIVRLAWVDAAKKNAPPIAAINLLTISKAANEMPSIESVEPRHIEDYLRSGIKILGTGIAVLICMLAVETDGAYPPMDRKFASGLRERGKVSEAELECLKGRNVEKFAEVYASKAIPAWRESRNSRTPEEADKYWGHGGRDGG
jgi:hypothetical protein